MNKLLIHGCWCNNLPPCVLEIVVRNSKGLMCLLVHTEIIGPWSEEEFGTNSEDYLLRCTEDYHRRLCVTKLTPKNC